MKEFIYKPQLVENGNLVFDGEVTIMIPKYADRIRLVKEINFSVNAKGEIENIANSDSMIKMIEKVIELVKSVNIKRVSDGVEINSVEDLEYDRQGAMLLNELGNVVMSGITLGKN